MPDRRDYYKAPEQIGPVSTERLQKILAAGCIDIGLGETQSIVAELLRARQREIFDELYRYLTKSQKFTGGEEVHQTQEEEKKMSWPFRYRRIDVAIRAIEQVFGQGTRIAETVRHIESLANRMLTSQLRMERDFMRQFDELAQRVRENSDRVDSAITVINELADKVEALKDSPTPEAIQALADELREDSERLGTAIANTDDEPVPEPEPTPEEPPAGGGTTSEPFTPPTPSGGGDDTGGGAPV